jgi:hypothetical protein
VNRIVGLLTGLLLGLILAVPIATAAEPWSWDEPLDRAEQLVISSGTDVVLPAGQDVRLFVVMAGHARIEGSVGTIIVLNGTAELVGSRTGTIVAIGSQILLDDTSAVTGEIRMRDSSIDRAPGATVGGVRDVGPDLAFGWIPIGSVLFLIYLAFAISAIAAGAILAGLAGRQVRSASAVITGEPVLAIVASFAGLFGLVLIAILAMVTVVGIPLGVGLLLIALPALFVAGYLVAGIALGEAIVARVWPVSVPRERPYLAAIVGLSVAAAVSLFPPFGGLISLVGVGAITVQVWRVLRRPTRSATQDRPVVNVAPAPG